MKKYLVVGAGLTGCVIARQLAENRGVNVIVIDKRDHTVKSLILLHPRGVLN